VVTEMIRPLGSGAAGTRGFDLRQVRPVFPVAAHPGPAEWIAGRIFYQFLGQVLRWLLILLAFLVIAYVAYEGLADVPGRASGGSRALRSVVIEAAYGVVVLAFALVVVFVVSRRTTMDVTTTLASRFPWLAPGSERSREEVAIRRLLEEGRPPPMAGDMSSSELAVFVSGHTHAPAMSELARADGRRTVIVNTGCWLRQLQPVEARLGGPPVFVPTFVHTHVRVRAGKDGLAVELWNHPRPAERQLPWIERAAIAGRTPDPPPPDAEPRLLARSVAARGARKLS
jgi:hypothetical protein